jgi:YD repeat-containing protein
VQPRFVITQLSILVVRDLEAGMRFARRMLAHWHRRLREPARRLAPALTAVALIASSLLATGGPATAAVNSPSSDSSSTPQVVSQTCSEASLPTPSSGSLAFAVESSLNQVQLIDESTGAVVGSPIAVGSDPTGITYWEPFAGSSHDPEILVANYSGNSVTVIDAITRVVVATISLPSGADPYSISASWNTPYAMVVDRGTGKVSIISLNSNTDVGEVSLSGSANTLSQTAFSALGSYGYVTDPTQHEIFVVEYTGGSSPYFTKETTWSNSSYNPTYLAVNYSNPASQGLVVSSTGSTSGNILMFNDSSGTLSSPVYTIAVGYALGPIQFADGTTYAWVVTTVSANVWEYTLSTQTFDKNLAISGFTKIGAIAVSADQSTLLSTDTGAHGIQGNSIASYATDYTTATAAPVTALVPAYPLKNSWNAYVVLAGNGANNIGVMNTGFNTAFSAIVQNFTDDNSPEAVAVSPDGQYAYIANTDSVSVVETSLVGVSSNPIVETIPVPQDSSLGDEPHVPELNGIAVSPSGDAVLVTDYANGAVDVIKTVPNSPTSDAVEAEIGLLGSGIDSTTQTTGGSVTFSPDGLFAYVTEFADSGHANDGVTILSVASGSDYNYGFDEYQTGLTEGSDTMVEPTQISVTPNDETVYVEGALSSAPTTDALFAFPVNATSGVSTGTLGSYSALTPTTWSNTITDAVFDPEAQNAYAVYNTSVGAADVTSADIGNPTMYEDVNSGYPVSIAGGAVDAAISPDGQYLAIGVQETSSGGCNYGTDSIEVFNPNGGGLYRTVDTTTAPMAIAFAPQATPQPLTPSQLAGGASNPAELAVSGGINDVVNAGTPADAPGVTAGVDTATGAYSLSLDSLTVNDVGLDLSQTATYDSSRSATAGLLGYGWTNSYGITATQAAYGGPNSCVITVTQEDGATVTFTPAAPGFTSCATVSSYEAPAWVEATLSVKSSCNGTDNCFVFQPEASTTYYIDATTGQLVKEVDLHGNTVTVTWGTHGSTCAGATSSDLCEVLGADGVRSLIYSYPSPGTGTCPSSASSCVVATDPIGQGSVTRNLTYAINASDQLVSATLIFGSQAATYSFEYNGSGLLDQWCDPVESLAGGCSGTSYAATTISYSSGLVVSVTGPSTTAPSVGVSVPSLGSAITATTTTFTRYEFDASTGNGTVLVANPDFTQSVSQLGADQTLDVYENYELIDSIDGYGPLADYGVTETSPDVQPTTFTPSVDATVMRDPLNLMPEETMDAMAGAQPSNGNSGATSAVSVYDTGMTMETSDANGDILTSTDPLGNTTTTTYNALDEPLTITDPFGNVTTNTYDAEGDLLTTSSPAVIEGGSPAVTSNWYNANGTLCASRDATEFAAYGTLTSCVSAGTNATVYGYDSSGDQTTVTTPPASGEPDGATTQSVYDADGSLCATVSADGYPADELSRCPTAGSAYATVNLVPNVYDSPNEVVTSTNSGTTFSITYTCTNSNGDAFESVGSLGSAPSCGASSWPVTSVTDTSFSAYNLAGEVVFTIAPTVTSGTQGATTVSEFDASATSIMSLSAQGYVAWVANNSTSLVPYETTSAVSNTGAVIGSGPDADVGEACLVSSTAPCPNAQVALDDANGANTTSVATTSSGAGVVASSSLYDGNGNVTSSTAPVDGQQETTLNFYDAQGNEFASETSKGTMFSSSTFVSGSESAYAPNGDECWSSPVYTAFTLTDGQPTEPTCTGDVPATATVDYENSSGTLIAQVGPGGANTVVPTTGGGCNPLAAYGAGTPGSSSALTISSPYSLNTAKICAFTTYDVYNQSGQEMEVAQPSASSSTSGYVSIGATTSYTYDASGNVLTVTNPSGTVTTNAYSASNQLIGIDYQGSSNNICTVSSVEYAVCYTYNTDGSRATMTDGAGEFTYSYNTQGQLTSETDSNGNTVTYGYDTQGQQDCVSYPGATANCSSYTYGSVPTSGSGLVGYTYDSEGRMSSVLDSNGDAFTYDYDCAGNVLFMVESPSNETLPSVTDCNQTGSEASYPTSTPEQSGGTYPIWIVTTYIYDNANNTGQMLYESTYKVQNTTETPLLGFGSSSVPLTYNPTGTLATSTPFEGTTEEATDTYNYDGQNRVTSGPESGSGTKNYTYVNSASQPGSFTTSKTVDNMGLASQYQGTSASGMQYAGNGELCWVESATVSTLTNPSDLCSSPGGSNYETLSYDASGDRTGITAHGYGTSSAYTWNQLTGTLSCANPRGTSCTGPSSSQPAAQSYAYGPDKLRMQSQAWNSTTSSVVTTIYTWDPRHLGSTEQRVVRLHLRPKSERAHCPIRSR